MKFNVVNDQEQESCQQRSGLCSAFIVFGSIRVGVGALGWSLVQPYPRSAHALLPNVLAGLLAATLGRDLFDQNFRKFRSKTQWIGSAQPEKFRKNWSIFWGGPLFMVVILVEWIAPLVTVTRVFYRLAIGAVIWGKWLLFPVPLGTSLPFATWVWTHVFACYHFVRKIPFFFSELVNITTSSLISKCHTTFLLGHSVIGYPCFASHSYPQKYGRKKIISLKNFVSMTDHFNFILLADVVFFFFVGLSNHNVPWPGC